MTIEFYAIIALSVVSFYLLVQLDRVTREADWLHGELLRARRLLDRTLNK